LCLQFINILNFAFSELWFVQLYVDCLLSFISIYYCCLFTLGK